MILSIHQPSYFPWLGYWHKVARSDVHLVLDEVQLSDKAFQHRNHFLTADGRKKYLTIPFVKKGYMEKRFLELEFSRPGWQKDHRNFLDNNYRKHPYFQEVSDALAPYWEGEYDGLFEAVLESMKLSMRLLGIEIPLLFQSELEYDRTLTRGEMVMEIIRVAGADVYLSGTGARAYMEAQPSPPGVEIRYDDFTHPHYPQCNTGSFESGLSCLDLLFNVGIEAARALTREMIRP